MVAPDPESYLAVLNASYDYDPQSPDEITIKEDQILFLVERTDDEYVFFAPACSLPHPSLAGGKSRSRATPRMRIPQLASCQQPMSNRSGSSCSL
jgi:hypothetical protein